MHSKKHSETVSRASSPRRISRVVRPVPREPLEHCAEDVSRYLLVLVNELPESRLALVPGQLRGQVGVKEEGLAHEGHELDRDAVDGHEGESEAVVDGLADEAEPGDGADGLPDVLREDGDDGDLLAGGEGDPGEAQPVLPLDFVSLVAELGLVHTAR